MTCAIYCLVPHPEQLDPLVGRLQDAGVATTDIMVVRRPGQAATDAVDAPSVAPPPYFIPALWSLPLGPAAWWWPLALPVPEWRASQAPELQPAPARTTEHEVIPLASYRAQRAAGAL